MSLHDHQEEGGKLPWDVFPGGEASLSLPFHPLLKLVCLQGEHGGGGDPVLWMSSGALRASDWGPALGCFPVSPREP